MTSAPTAQRTLELRQPSVLAALFAHADQAPDRPALTFVTARAEPVRVSYGQLLRGAARAGAAMDERGVRSGDRVLIGLPEGPEFVTAFLGTQLLGAVPTATAAPSRLGGSTVSTEHFGGLVSSLRPTTIISSRSLLGELSQLETGATLLDGDELHELTTTPGAPEITPRMPEPDSLALIQCTSGSVGNPKGVMISHANLAANCEQISRVCAWTDADVIANWLPMYHDFGLVCGLFTPIFTGGHSVTMPPGQFLRKPVDWLRLISDHRATITSAQNFALGYAAARIHNTELAGVRLSSLRMLLCGGEPINPLTVDRFGSRFSSLGLPERFLSPAYGMAEATLALTTESPGTGMHYDTVARAALSEHGLAIDTLIDDPDAVRIVDCGPPLEDVELRVVDSLEQPVDEDVVGHIQFRGPARTVGYFELPEETTAAHTADGWWRTGDMGYLRGGRLRVTGRSKDAIIIRGANHFPTDFETIIEGVSGVRAGGVVAVGYRAPHEDSESLHLVVETDVDSAEHEGLRRRIRAAVSNRTSVFPESIQLLPKRSIPKTTSGKVRRAQTRRMFLETR